uniref:Signal recognition particle subunit SRP54 n=1 Tax=Biomphalaria glabrata TaxID=6526 RepID=A0A2C9KT35_BIOGL
MKKKGITKPLMIAADVYRPAAIDQLKTLGRELQIDVFAKGTDSNPRDIAVEGIAKAKAEDYDLVIVDTAGRLAIDENLMQELYDIKKLINPHEILFVADALSGQDIINVAEAFNNKLQLTGSIITKLDSDARGGAALSIRQLLNIPIKFIGTGEKATALDLFYPERMAERILGMGDVLSLIEKAEEVLDEKKSQKMINRMVNGQFDLNDLMDQMAQMKKLGSMSKVVKMIPGMSGKIDAARLDDSSRKNRILKGSGRTPQEYNQLINEFERMHKQMIHIAKSIKDGSFNPGMMN